MFPREWIVAAAERIAPCITRTPVTHDPRRDLYFKWENRQKTGSFKARGALNKVLTLEDWERDAGLVAASAGNHGQGVALAAGMVGARATVFAPESTPAVKVEKMRALGADLRLLPGSYEQVEIAALRYAYENNQTWVSPYNDPQVIAGQGTIGLELLEQVPLAPELTVLIPIGGGGLLSGIAAALRSTRRGNGAEDELKLRIVGVQPEASAFMYALVTRGNIEGVRDLPTVADGLAGGVEEGSFTIGLVRELADEILLVNEDRIAEAIAFAWRHYQEQIEGSGAVGLAAVLDGQVKGPAVVIVSGGNIQPELHAMIVSQYGEQS
jgi:threonine dehydratase